MKEGKVDIRSAYELFGNLLDVLWYLQMDKYSVDGVISSEMEQKIGKEQMEIDKLMREYLDIK